MENWCASSTLESNQQSGSKCSEQFPVSAKCLVVLQIIVEDLQKASSCSTCLLAQVTLTQSVVLCRQRQRSIGPEDRDDEEDDEEVPKSSRLLNVLPYIHAVVVVGTLVMDLSLAIYVHLASSTDNFCFEQIEDGEASKPTSPAFPIDG